MMRPLLTPPVSCAASSADELSVDGDASGYDSWGTRASSTNQVVGQKRKSLPKCSLSEFVKLESVIPPIQMEQRRSRRKKPRNEEEAKRRAEERKVKNRQSAMRSRQRVLNELQANKNRVEVLEKENKSQKELIQKLQKQLEDALGGSTDESSQMATKETNVPTMNSLVPLPTFDFLDDFLEQDTDIQHGGAQVTPPTREVTVDFDVSEAQVQSKLLPQMSFGLSFSISESADYGETARFEAPLAYIFSQLLESPFRLMISKNLSNSNVAHNQIDMYLRNSSFTKTSCKPEYFIESDTSII